MMRRRYQHAADTWAEGRTLRSKQVRVNKVKGITVAYGKRLPIGGRCAYQGYYPYHRPPTTGTATSDAMDKHDKDVAQAINQVCI